MCFACHLSPLCRIRANSIFISTLECETFVNVSSVSRLSLLGVCPSNFLAPSWSQLRFHLVLCYSAITQRIQFTAPGVSTVRSAVSFIRRDHRPGFWPNSDPIKSNHLPTLSHSLLHFHIDTLLVTHSKRHGFLYGISFLHVRNILALSAKSKANDFNLMIRTGLLFSVSLPK